MPSVVFNPIVPARLEWQGDLPFSAQFGDVYFSREGGAAETEYVFLRGNDLPNRWKNKPHFTILETGFGTGLNFLCTAEMWQKTKQKDQWLYYISVEKHPIDIADLRRLHGNHPLLSQLPPAIPGFHWHIFEEERIALLLIYADLETALSDLDAKIDAWFLDGFAPAKNPEMWGDALYEGMRNLSADGATFATYTAAKSVRDGLERAGFNYERVKGFGHKKHMLRGALIPPPKRESVLTPPQGGSSAIVIGGGLAGTSAAGALARHGFDVTLIERHASLAQEASGNPAAILKPYLAKEWAAQTLLYNQAFYFTRNQAKKLELFHEIGAVQLDENPRHLELGLPAFQAQLLNRDEASKRIGLAVKLGGVYQPEAGWLSPVKFCQMMAQNAKIKTILETEALTLKQDGNMWRVNDKYEAPYVIIANAKDALSFASTAHLPLIPMRGQISIFPRNKSLNTIVNYGGYALPHGDYMTLGATYDRRDMDATIRDEDTMKNISEYNDVFMDFIAEKPIGGRVAWRTTTPSKRPIVGAIGQGLFVSLGLASRGALLAPYMAEQIVSEITGTPHLLQKSVKQVLLRF